MATHGKNGKVKLGSNLVADTTKWTLNISVETADTTSQGDSWQSHLSGIPAWSGSCDALTDMGDTNGQNALTIGASVSIGFYHDGDGTGKKYYSGTATVTGINTESDMKAANKVSFSFQGNGALTVETVSA